MTQPFRDNLSRQASRNRAAAPGRTVRGRGMALMYAAVMVLVILGFVSFAVDYGRVQTAKTELANAVDAAARYAVTGIHNSSTLARAQSAAVQNKVDGNPLTLLAGDVQVGTWDRVNKTFTVGGASPNAVRVSCERSGTRSNAIPLLFARAIGQTHCDIHASAVALFDTTPDVVGRNSVYLRHNTTRIERLGSETGTVVVGSNGTFTTHNASQITGNALYRGAPPSASIAGTKTLMTADLSYPAVSTPSVLTDDYGPVSWSGGNYPLAGGVYQCDSMSFTSGVLTLTGDVDVYCSGNVTISGSAYFNTGNGTYRLRLFMTGSGTSFTHNSSGTTYMSFYGPNADFEMNGGVICGSVIARTIDLSNGSKISYTRLLPNFISPTAGGTTGNAIATVR